MTKNPAGGPESAKICARCAAAIEPGREYEHQGRHYCEECCLEVRSPRVRKTHWQYLRSIKGDYLRPAEED